MPAAVEDTYGEPDSSSNAIIDKYLEATNQKVQTAHSMEVEINASVPSLRQHGKLRALRKISKVGLITYRVLGFQGDNTVKKEVIARYLQAEQQSQSDSALAINPANYKFKLKGKRAVEDNEMVYMFQIAPRHKKVGLFKGELWLDANSYLPVLEKGRLVKNPSIFFKKVDFERAFAIQDGVALPAHLTSTIQTRLVGKVELDIAYKNIAEDVSDDSATSTEDSVAFSSPSTR